VSQKNVKSNSFQIYQHLSSDNSKYPTDMVDTRFLKILFQKENPPTILDFFWGTSDVQPGVSLVVDKYNDKYANN